MANVKFKLVNDAEQASEAIEDRKLLYNYESKKIYVDSGTTTRIEFYGFIGSLPSLLTTVKTSIVGAINEIFAKPKQAPTGTKVVVATSLSAGNVFTAPSNGVYQLRVSFTANSGYVVMSHSNGQSHQINSAPVPNYGQTKQIPVNTNQTITVSAISSTETIEVAFFPMA